MKQRESSSLLSTGTEFIYSCRRSFQRLKSFGSYLEHGILAFICTGKLNILVLVLSAKYFRSDFLGYFYSNCSAQKFKSAEKWCTLGMRFLKHLSQHKSCYEEQVGCIMNDDCCY